MQGMPEINMGFAGIIPALGEFELWNRESVGPCYYADLEVTGLWCPLWHPMSSAGNIIMQVKDMVSAGKHYSRLTIPVEIQDRMVYRLFHQAYSWYFSGGYLKPDWMVRMDTKSIFLSWSLGKTTIRQELG